MSAVASLLERLAPEPDPGARATRGRSWLDAHGLPDRREEAWRYTPVDDIIAALETAGPAPDGSSAIDRSVVDELAGDHGGPRLVVVNGLVVPHLSTLGSTPAGMWLGGADGLRPRRRPGAPPPQDEPADGFHALNWAAGRDVAAVLVEPGTEADAPVHVVHVSAPGEITAAIHPRTVIRLGAGSRLHVIESFVGFGLGIGNGSGGESGGRSGGRSLTNASTRIIAGEDASLTHHRIVAESREAIHVGRTGLEQAARSTVRSSSVITGGDIVRSAVDVHLAGAEARVDLDGLYLATDRQRHDNVITVDHAASHCTSNQRLKGIVDDRARGSFSGHVIVRPGTVGTDANQSNPNLVLAPTAQADTRPWLEIFADDVRCTHGATVGRLDDEALFYLRSRGIPREEGRAMLIAAFAAEVIDAITPVSLRDRTAAAVDERTTEANR